MKCRKLDVCALTSAGTAIKFISNDAASVGFNSLPVIMNNHNNYSINTTLK